MFSCVYQQPLWIASKSEKENGKRKGNPINHLFGQEMNRFLFSLIGTCEKRRGKEEIIVNKQSARKMWRRVYDAQPFVFLFFFSLSSQTRQGKKKFFQIFPSFPQYPNKPKFISHQISPPQRFSSHNLKKGPLITKTKPT